MYINLFWVTQVAVELHYGELVADFYNTHI